MTNWNELQQRKNEILELSKQFGAENIRVFGSVARGEETENSDIDFLVTMKPGKNYFDLIDFQMCLAEMFHQKVDVVSDRGLYHMLRDRILNEARPL